MEQQTFDLSAMLIQRVVVVNSQNQVHAFLGYFIKFKNLNRELMVINSSLLGSYMNKGALLSSPCEEKLFYFSSANGSFFHPKN